MRWFMRYQFVFMALLVSLALVVPSLWAAQPMCFPETDQCIDGRFRQYWQQNGGLPVFGFPITAARNELNRDTGQRYLTQWFERNRFELHTENRPPYDVLLGRLGDDRLRQLGRNWRTEDGTGNPFPGTACQEFVLDGDRRSVCGPFLQYWRSHGLSFDGRSAVSYDESLALFGLPLTAPRQETNPDGDRVLTQWFERARFEWHPGNRDPFKVLLGRLGAELRVAPPPPPTPTPTSQLPYP